MFRMKYVKPTIDIVVSNRGGKNPPPRIKVVEANIIVTGTAEKPYYEIMYRRPGSLVSDVGFGSTNLKNCFQWLNECFDFV